jgi:hypothetical protein
VLPLRDEPKIQANRPGSVTEISGLTPWATSAPSSNRDSDSL